MDKGVRIFEKEQLFNENIKFSDDTFLQASIFRGIIYVWIAQQSDPHDHETVKMVANEMINRDNESFPVVVIKEDEEPEEFWQGMGGKKK